MHTDDKDEIYLPLSEIVYRRIRRLILRSGLNNGPSLTEIDLANRFHVSKTPVREALRRLAQEGLIVTNPHRGAKIVGLTRLDLEEIYLMRSRLESLAARIAAERVTPQDAARLRALMAKLKAQTSAGSTDEIHRLNVRLHELIWRASRTNRLTQTLSSLQDYVEMSRSTLLAAPKGGETILGEHSAIVQAILDRDPDRAEAAMARHIGYLVDELRAGMRAEAEG